MILLGIPLLSPQIKDFAIPLMSGVRILSIFAEILLRILVIVLASEPDFPSIITFPVAVLKTPICSK
jgi:hypothetical protein